MTTLKADPTSIRAKATKINGEWPAVPASPIPPDMLQLAGLAMQQIAANHERLQSCVASGEAEAARLAACLEAAAKAYEQVDQINKTEIESGQPSGTDAVTINPVLPPQVPATGGMCYGAPGNPYEEWPTAAAQLAAANMNVLDYAEEMYAFADAITTRAKDFSPGDTHWEGLAAEAAEGKMRQHESWLYEVATKSREIAKQAQDFYNAHEKAKADHPEPLAGDSQVMDFNEYNEKQVKSEQVRGVYSTEATFTSIDTPAPPEGAYAPTPVFKKDVPPLPEKDDGQQPGDPAAGDPAAGGGGVGGGQPGGAPSETAAVSPASAQNGQQAAKSGEQSGGSPSGGQGSGGSPSGGGQGSGGSPAGGAPTGLPEGLTDMPTDPAIRPASAEPTGGGGPGSGSGGGGGGGGGGTPNQPLAPAAGASAPSSSPAAVAGGGGAAPVGAAGPGGAMGGMPMGGGHGMGGQGGGAKERRRTPGLSPDEELYVEDRASTEPVIGLQRPRRGKDGGQDKENT
ncbi:hypothetical protein AB0K11_15160 [Mycobacterium sp. NPDC050551]|uniref:PPE domain-containing protein n=1 Tax=Mycobacterium sp. NPDC050551 TaxID=3155407 RepID=UPI003423110D